MRPIVALIALGSVATAHAQPAPPHPEKSVYVGPRVGVNAAWLAGDDINEADFEQRIGAHAGGFVMVALTRFLAAEGGVFFSQKGTAFANGSFKLDYLQAELIGVVHATVGHNVKARGIYGTTIAYNVRSRLVLGTADNSIEDEIEELDIGLVLGVGIESNTSRGLIVVDGRYEHGLRRVDGIGDRDQIRNRLFTVSAGFGF